MLGRFLIRAKLQRLVHFISRNQRRGLSHARPKNEPVLDYQSDPKSPHRLELDKQLARFQAETQDVPIVIKGKEYRTSETRYQLIPFEHKHRLAQFYYASHELIQKATQEALGSQREWIDLGLERRVELFEKAADLVSGKYRQQLNAATMLGQAKTIRQAEIDSAAELADFLRFNAYYMRELKDAWQPISDESESNSVEFRPLDGFVAAISPFNFTAIAGNIATAPALLGNCVVWKPSDTAILSNYLVFQLLKEAGFPDGVLNFVPSAGLDFGRLVTSDHQLGAINFTGSLTTFQWLWSEVGLNIKRYSAFPRLIGECGGKNFHLIHRSADLDTAVVQTIRSAFEFSGQKCSACSRLYVPQSLWPDMKQRLVSTVGEQLKFGPATDFDSFSSAVIDQTSYKRITKYISYAKRADEFELVCGGGASDQIGYFVEPTIFETKNPLSRLMQEEIFGPVLSVYVYPDSAIDKVMELIGQCQYALTGAIFAQDEQFIETASRRLLMNAGNLYINDKSTGAVVGRQPFGGAKLSGTNDKAGGAHYLMRFCNQRTVKRTKRHMREFS